jgi:molybdopterin/thiamine biosynthesis adenylyltransferase
VRALRRIREWGGRLLGGRSTSPAPVESTPCLEPLSVDVRIEADLLAVVRERVEDFTRGEEAGFLVCAVSELPGRFVLLAREWLPIPESEIERNVQGSVLSWSAKFNGEALQRAFDLNGTLVLVHSHGRAHPHFSSDDRRKEPPVFAPASRMLDPFPTGSMLLGAGDAVGSFWRAGERNVRFRRLVVLGETISVWRSEPLAPRARKRLARLAPVIGPEGDAKLADVRVAVIGISGGGSHVVQQLAHQGVGALIPDDDELVDETNLGRVVGATHVDVDRTRKTDLAERVAKAIDPDISVVKVNERFPSPAAIEALKSADVIVSCVDTFRAREAINLFCRRYLIPLVDIGMTIETRGERLVRADGQVIVSIPGYPCMRCWFLTDAVLAREEREHPAGYDRNPDAPGDPQVVSMNGTLASEACNCVLDLVTGYSGGERGARWWLYDGRSGQLERHETPSHRPDCPACAEQRLGDPTRP